jgi:branched-subunit amino acid aminotransferase/4-amino-4-deoxychorismate lyase
MSGILFEFTGSRLEKVDEDPGVLLPTLVADSWRVTEGQVVGLWLHLERFRGSTKRHTSLDDHVVDTFLERVVEELPLHGEWFPRIEVVDAHQGPLLRYRKRAAPPMVNEVVIARASYDPRVNPFVKGPDLAALEALRTGVSHLQAGEAIIVDRLDTLIEGAYSTVLTWLPGTEELSIVPHAVPRLPSVTEDILVSLAQERTVSVVERSISVAHLAGAEVWIVSALQGIRVATAFREGPELDHAGSRAKQWQELWQAQATNLRS